MADLSTAQEDPVPKKRIMPPGLDPLAKALIGVLDDQHDSLIGEVRSFRKLAWAGLGGVFVLLLVLILALIETRGVDSGKVADAAVEIVHAARPTTTSEAALLAPEEH